ncbi:palmitoyl-protein thioesterase [Monoraphidium neglectum]|uniref:Palmitoyl-protein thioesterase 1 n=1 Tax=Monoraphidium neglectum TaxID=145388 RepID=A0A0D2MGK1_9CHLO|nr:palmitoyl-protein thioesterase [Monoraphidium neglectum]KIZ02205.1 palmitoyl-protein thioesterase [Monoraphidium neglectum]|eukprot:XP_013901224.1 palmitoyl-protein thioesterase [Monoraphidium neglectum]
MRGASHTVLALLVAILAISNLPYGICARAQPESVVLQALRGNVKDGAKALPVVLWHGMGDSCCAAGGMGAVKQLIEDELGVFVHSIATGEGEYHDIWSSFMGNVNAQVEIVCGQLSKMPELKHGFNAIGFSQGGQFLRAVVERCAHTLPPIRTLVTVGGQHQGVMNTPGCTQDADGWSAKACAIMQTLLARGAYAPWVRENVVQAQYFKDPSALLSYVANNIFLADINNERAEKNPQYADNLASLDRLVLYRFDDDTTVVPRDSAWFSFFDGKDTVAIQDQPIYKEDWIGLKRLDEKGGLIMESAPGEHMQFTLSWFRREIVQRWLSAPGDDQE